MAPSGDCSSNVKQHAWLLIRHTCLLLHFWSGGENFLAKMFSIIGCTNKPHGFLIIWFRLQMRAIQSWWIGPKWRFPLHFISTRGLGRKFYILHDCTILPVNTLNYTEVGQRLLQRNILTFFESPCIKTLSYMLLYKQWNYGWSVVYIIYLSSDFPWRFVQTHSTMNTSK